MGWPNYTLAKDLSLISDDILLGADIQHTEYSGSYLYVHGIPTSEYPTSEEVTVIINGVSPPKKVLSVFEKLDNKIFTANVKYINEYIKGSELRCTVGHMDTYRVPLEQSLTLTGKTPTTPKEYTIVSNTINAFKYGDAIRIKDETYTFIKWAYRNDRLLYAVESKQGSISIINYDEVLTEPTHKYSIAFQHSFYVGSTENGMFKEIQVNSIFTDYYNVVNYLHGSTVRLQEYRHTTEEITNLLTVKETVESAKDTLHKLELALSKERMIIASKSSKIDTQCTDMLSGCKANYDVYKEALNKAKIELLSKHYSMTLTIKNKITSAKKLIACAYSIQHN